MRANKGLAFYSQHTLLNIIRAKGIIHGNWFFFFVAPKVIWKMKERRMKEDDYLNLTSFLWRNWKVRMNLSAINFKKLSGHFKLYHGLMLLWGRVVSRAAEEEWEAVASLQERLPVCLWTYNFGYNNTSVLFWHDEDKNTSLHFPNCCV